MKTLLIAALVCAAATQARAQTAEPPAPVVISAPQLFALPAQQNRLWYNEFESVSGSYALSNGQRMSLSLDGERMYANIDGMGRMRLVAESPYVFVALNRQLRITAHDPAKPYRGSDADVEMIVPKGDVARFNGKRLKEIGRR